MKKGSFLLLLTAFIWGMAFVAQSVAMDAIGPWTFNCTRSLIAGVTLLVFMPFFKKDNQSQAGGDRRMLIKGGIACGICLGAASMFQQAGIMTTTVGKAGFITALYVVFVPVISIFLGRKMEKKIWLCTLLAVAGLYFLCMTESLTLQQGDMLVLICAVLFAVHILCIDHFTPYTDGIRMSCIQFFTAGFLCMIGMLIFEKPHLSDLLHAAGPILYAGILSSGAGYTMQIIGQKDTDPSVASLLMSLESVFAVLGGWLLLHETLSGREIFGCLLTFSAVLIAQLPVGALLHRDLHAGDTK